MEPSKRDKPTSVSAGPLPSKVGLVDVVKVGLVQSRGLTGGAVGGMGVVGFGLRVVEFHPSVVRANGDVLRFYEQLDLGAVGCGGVSTSTASTQATTSLRPILRSLF